MKKRIVASLLAVSILAMTLALASCSGLFGDLEYELLSDGTFGVKASKNFSGEELEIPATHLGRDVTQILDSGFSGVTSLKSVTIPDTVTTIGWSAFENCSALETVVIPDSVTEINSAAFFYCTALKNINIPVGVTAINKYTFIGCSSLENIVLPAGVTVIDSVAFSACSSLQSITIPEGVTTVGEGAFSYCSNLKEIKLPESVKTIGTQAFAYCSTLENVNIPDGVAAVEAGTFRGCKMLKTITVPKSVKKIGDQAFNGCLALSKVNLSNGLTEIGASAFYNCKNLAVINIPDTVVSIGNDAFYACDYVQHLKTPASFIGIVPVLSLKSVEITNGEIPADAFSGCISLVKVTLGEGVTKIGKAAFKNCHKLVEVQNLSKLSNIVAGETNRGQIAKNAKNIYSANGGESKLVEKDGFWYYCDEKETVLMGMYITMEEAVLPETFEGKTFKVNNYAFYNEVNLKKLTVPSINVYKFLKEENKVFDGCNNLEFLKCDVAVTKLVPLHNLKTLELVSGGAKDLINTKFTLVSGSNVVSTLPALENLVIHDGIASIGTTMFMNCKTLKNVTIGSGVKLIELNAFAGCEVLNNVVFTNTDGWCVDEMKSLPDGTVETISKELSASDIATPEKAARMLTVDYALFPWRYVAK